MRLTTAEWMRGTVQEPFYRVPLGLSLIVVNNLLRKPVQATEQYVTHIQPSMTLSFIIYTPLVVISLHQLHVHPLLVTSY